MRWLCLPNASMLAVTKNSAYLYSLLSQGSVLYAPNKCPWEIFLWNLALAAIALYCSGWGWTSRTLEWGNLFFRVLFHYFMLVNGWPSCCLVSSSVYLQTRSWFKRFISLFHQLCSTTHYFVCPWEIRDREGNSPPIPTTEVILYKVEWMHSWSTHITGQALI